MEFKNPLSVKIERKIRPAARSDIARGIEHIKRRVFEPLKFLLIKIAIKKAVKSCKGIIVIPNKRVNFNAEKNLGSLIVSIKYDKVNFPSSVKKASFKAFTKGLKKKNRIYIKRGNTRRYGINFSFNFIILF